MGHCPQSNHHRSYRHSGSFRSGRLQIAMRTITLLIVHCSATPQGVALGFEDCRRDHIHHRGFRDIGYHFYLTRNGKIHRGRPLEKIGAHCLNHNRHSIGICYEGGLDAASFPADTRTLEQKASLLALLRESMRKGSIGGCKRLPSSFYTQFHQPHAHFFIGDIQRIKMCKRRIILYRHIPALIKQRGDICHPFRRGIVYLQRNKICSYFANEGG